MTKEYFTLDEVNELVPQLEYHFQKLLFHKKEMAQCSNRLRRLGVAPQLLGRVPNDARPEIHQLQTEVRGHYRDFKNHLFAIENMGGEIKDLELGRVDFPARREGEEVWLSWQLGFTDGVCVLENEEEGEDDRVNVVIEQRPEYPI